MRWSQLLVTVSLIGLLTACIAPDRIDYSPDDEVDDSGGINLPGDDDDLSDDDDDLVGPMPGDDDDDLSDDDDDLSDDDDDLSDDDDTSGGSALDGDLRLAGTGSGFEGRIEIYYSGQWGTICDDSWGTADAQVACRQLGLPSESAEAVGNAAFGPGDESMEIWLDNVGCSGSEQRIEDCDHDGWQQHNCVHDEDAGVRCL